MKAIDEDQLLQCLETALAGDAAALEKLLIALKDPLFRLSLRTLGNFADAEDATQEILVKIMTALASFERRSSIRTWAFRIGVNHLRDVVARRGHAPASFEEVAEQLGRGFALTPDFTRGQTAADPALELEAREIGLHCLQGILMCLDTDERLAYVLSEVFDLDTSTAAQVAGVGAATYRQRLSRGRRRLEAFLGQHCGLVNAAASCTCRRQAQALRRAQGGRPVRIRFARGAPATAEEIAQARADLSRLQRIALLFRNSPEWSTPDGVLEHVRRTILSSALFNTSETASRPN
ncbi:MAG: RNA polymerase sigma factor [Sulfurifustis sp.]